MKAASKKPKGARLEKKVVDLFLKIGWRAHRQYGSGRDIANPHDVAVEHPTRGRAIVECKARSKGLATLDRLKGTAEFLVVQGDYERDPWVCMRWSDFAYFVGMEAPDKDPSLRSRGFRKDIRKRMDGVVERRREARERRL